MVPHPIKIDDLGGFLTTPIFGNTHSVFLLFRLSTSNISSPWVSLLRLSPEWLENDALEDLGSVPTFRCSSNMDGTTTSKDSVYSTVRVTMSHGIFMCIYLHTYI